MVDNLDLKPVKGIEEWTIKQFPDNRIVYYTRKGVYAKCHCAECGAVYNIRAVASEDPFSAAVLEDTEKPERDKNIAQYTFVMGRR